jgi:L-threonylcarbamoyladenylate synthase
VSQSNGDSPHEVSRRHAADLRGDIEKAVDILRRGDVVAFPTETVYGLGANALDAVAVARIFEIKGRPRFDPLIVHAADTAAAEALVTEFPPEARKLAEAFWPGPLTLVLPKRDCICDIVTAGLPTVAVRVPDHPLALKLLRAVGLPLAAPSANPFGRISPTSAEHVREQLGDQVPLILDGGPCRVGLESTIVSLASARPALLRPGGLPAEEIERLIGPLERVSPLAPTDHPQAPGMLARHYAPRTPLVMVDDLAGARRFAAERAGRRLGLLAMDNPREGEASGFEMVEVLAAGGDMRRAAAGLFAAMHRLDGAGLDLIVAQSAPAHGLGLAINDRLTRAAHSNDSGDCPCRGMSL